MSARVRESTSALQLVEDAAHLLRRMPVTVGARYYTGAIVFWFSLFQLWAEMTSGAASDDARARLALQTALAYLWMKLWHAWFAKGLWRMLDPEAAFVRPTAGNALRVAAAQAAVHASSTILLPLAFIITLPAGWAVAFYQSASACALLSRKEGAAMGMRELCRTALTCSLDTPRRNHVVLLHLSLLAPVLAFSCWVGLIQLLYLARSLLGIETLFTLSLGAIFNPTLLFTAVLLCAMMTGPLLKAVYVVRCFESISRSSGANLFARLRALVEAA